MTCATCGPECLRCGNKIDPVARGIQKAGAWALCAGCLAIGYRMVKVGTHWKLRTPDGHAGERCKDIEYRRRMAE